jgi:deoxycytidylate deaminase
LDGKRPELVFGLVGPLGTDLALVVKSLQKELEKVQYDSNEVKLSDLLSEIDGLKNSIVNSSEYDRIESRMNCGDELRETVGGDALAILAMGKIQKIRMEKTGEINVPYTNYAHILKSLKHTNEEKKLRKVYGKNFWLISVFSSRESRVESLASKLGSPSETYREKAEKLITRDYHDEEEIKSGQDVRETFPSGDVFIDASHPNKIDEQINRFIELIFGNTFHTPHKEEYGMFHAYGSSLRSSSLSRQVGASILDKNGNLISTGTNEVPKAGGGVYSSDDKLNDHREFVLGIDSNQQEKVKMLKDIFERLKIAKWLSVEQDSFTETELAKQALGIDILKEMQFMDLTEYGREVHAEMDALVSAARGTTSVKDCLLYCTTFPCHICAKHIVSSGIGTVVFIEPYPKSHAKDLFSDSISVGEKTSDKVHFKPFFGIAPRRYVDLFRMMIRKDKKTGQKIDWIASQSEPRFWELKDVAIDESDQMNKLLDKMKEKALLLK